MGTACDNAITYHPRRRVQPVIAAVAAMLAFAGCEAQAQTKPEEPVKLQIIGGLAGVTQYTKIEQPFWQSEISALSKGRISATIRPLDAGGLRNQEMLQLMRLGVVSFGTALLSAVALEAHVKTLAEQLSIANAEIDRLRPKAEAADRLEAEAEGLRGQLAIRAEQLDELRRILAEAKNAHAEELKRLMEQPRVKGFFARLFSR